MSFEAHSQTKDQRLYIIAMFVIIGHFARFRSIGHIADIEL